MRKFLIGLLFQVLLFPIIVAQSTFTWTGGTSSDPGVGSNWSGGTAPTITGGVVADYLNIGTGTYYPIFTSNIIIGDAGKLVNGNITVNAGASIQFDGDLSVEPLGIYTFLLIKSSIEGDGKIKFDDPLTSTPEASVELQLLGGSSYFHYFVPPVSSMSLWTTPSLALSQTQTSLGVGASFAGNLVKFTESKAIATKEAGWQWFDGYGVPATIAFKSLNSYTGYNIYFSSNTKMVFKGPLNSQENTFTLSYTSGNAGAGWNLIGNPYPCNFDLNGVSVLNTDDDGVSNTVYYNKDGGYVYWNVKDNIGSTDCSDIIPPMQGFFVKVTAAPVRYLTLPTAYKTFSASQARTKGYVSTKSETTQKIKLVLTSPSLSDETIVSLFDDATVDFNENHDGVKLFGSDSSPYIYSEINGKDYFLKAITKLISRPFEVPLKVVLNEAGNHSIQITEFDNLEAYKITLKHGDIQVPLSLGTIYNFNSNSGTYSDYSLVFNSILTGVDNPNETLLKTWYRNNYLYINYPSDFKAGKIEINIYDFNGRKVFGNKNLDITPGETKQIQVSLQKGFYLTETITGLKQYKSKIVVY